MEKSRNTIRLMLNNEVHFDVAQSELESKSLYYQRLICSGMRDANNKELNLFHLSDVGLKAVVNYVQTSSVQVPDTADNCYLEILQEIIEAGSFLQIDGLLNVCEERLMMVVSVSLWKHVLDIANAYCLKKLKCFVQAYLCKHFSDCSKMEDFELLHIDDLLAVLDSDETEADERHIFAAAYSWISFDQNRLSCAESVFATVRFPLMTDTEITDCTSLLSALGCLELCTNILKEVKNYAEQSNLVVIKKNLRRRCTVKALLAIGGFTVKEHSTSRMQLLPWSDFNQQTASSASPGTVALLSCRNEKLMETVCEHGACVFNNILYVAGGQHRYCSDGRYTTNNVYCFDPILTVWSSCASMQVPRSLFYFGELDGCLFAITGCTAPNSDTPTVERYSPSEDKWLMLNPVTVEVHELAGCKHNGTFFISGGFCGPARGHIDLLWRYNKSEDTWEQMASMTTARSYHTMASTGSHIIVAGGVKYLGINDFEDIKECEIYHPEFNQWTIVAQLEHVASCMSYILEDGKIFLFGGHSFRHNQGHSYLQVLDLQTYKCHSVTFQSHNIAYFVTVLIDLPKKYVNQFH